jgi:hypothetical protein
VGIHHKKKEKRRTRPLENYNANAPTKPDIINLYLTPCTQTPSLNDTSRLPLLFRSFIRHSIPIRAHKTRIFQYQSIHKNKSTKEEEKEKEKHRKRT